MKIIARLKREAGFAKRERSLGVWLLIIFSLSTIAITSGIVDIRQQEASITRLIEADRKERNASSEKLTNWGSAAYYSFHLTYDRPSDFAFAAMGQRDLQPWKHRIRMLALEGQIYERDTGNPVSGLIGRFDFAFLATFVLPLILIIVLYSARASERTAGREHLLEATVGKTTSLWITRATVRSGMIYLSLLLPLWIASTLQGTEASKVLLASVLVLFYTLFWAFLCYVFGAWKKPPTVILMGLVGVWLCLAVILPAMFKLAIDRIVPMPSDADILLLQRETVNDAWDLPRADSMEAFFIRHPDFAEYRPKPGGFEWQWYYAFQQVGDQRTESVSTAYREDRIARDRLAAWLSIITPPTLLERELQALANTDLLASIEYEMKVRRYHRTLREFYYPGFFFHTPFDKNKLKSIPDFESIE